MISIFRPCFRRRHYHCSLHSDQWFSTGVSFVLRHIVCVSSRRFLILWLEIIYKGYYFKKKSMNRFNCVAIFMDLNNRVSSYKKKRFSTTDLYIDRFYPAACFSNFSRVRNCIYWFNFIKNKSGRSELKIQFIGPRYIRYTFYIPECAQILSLWIV